jgi:hypothetical protein
MDRWMEEEHDIEDAKAGHFIALLVCHETVRQVLA